MSCGRRPVYRNIGYYPGHCLLSETAQDACPAGWVEDGYVKIPQDVSRRRARERELSQFCIQDGLIGADHARFRKRCRKVAWNPDSKSACCAGRINTDFACAPEWCFESKACDATMQQYCKNPRNQTRPECGCLLPQSAYEETKLYGPPECVDKRCAGNPQAYQTERQRNRVCEITNCVIGGDLSIEAEENLDTEIIAQECGPRFKDLREKGKTSQDQESDFIQHIRDNKVAYGIGGGVAILAGLVGGGYLLYQQYK